MSFTLKLKTFIRRYAVRLFGLSRPSSSPFISGDSFRALAQHVYDESSDFNPDDVNEGDIVFVRTSWLNDFFNKIESSIKHPYILISHNEDTSITEAHAAQFVASGKIIHWFAQNLTFSHKNFSALPIGFQNFYYKNDNALENIRSIKNECLKKENFALCAFGIKGNGNALERENIMRTAKNIPWIQTSVVNGLEYIKALAKSKFAISPAGSGEDCHRTWEALYLDTIPVVRRTPMTEYYSSIGLPLFIVDSWGDLEKITEQELQEFHIKNPKPSESEALYMPYWTSAIQEKQAKN